MRFRFLLWLLGCQLARASRHSCILRHCLQGRRLVFQLQTRDGRVARHFIVGEQRILSLPGLYPHADLSLVFRDSHAGCQALDPRQRQLVLLGGIQNGDIEFRGNPALSLWLQDLLDCLDRSRQQPPGLPASPPPPLLPRHRDPAGRDHG